MKTPEQLRQQARELRESAAHADRSADAKSDARLAGQLEAEAARLENAGAAPAVAAPRKTWPEIEAEAAISRWLRVDAAIKRLSAAIGQGGGR